jgi:electron transfer flavoprotein alpha subunit
MSTIAIIPDTDARGLPDATIEDLLGMAVQLREYTGFSIACLFLTSGDETAARETALRHGIDCVSITSPALSVYTAEGYTTAIAHYCRMNPCAFICAPHTSRGCDFAPALAVRLNAACVTQVHAFSVRDNAALFSRASAHGKVETDNSVSEGTAVVTVMKGAFHGRAHGGLENPPVSAHAVEVTLTHTLSSFPRRAATPDPGIDRAEVIVSAGRGVSTPERMELVRNLAKSFSRSAVAGSRIACDMGLVPYAAQVGMTGRTVAPKLYIACGISGSLQHVAGMKNSKTIVAINRDPDAPIFKIADAGIVEDLERFLPALIAELKKS